MMKTLSIILVLLINYQAAKKYLVEIGAEDGQKEWAGRRGSDYMFRESLPACSPADCKEISVSGAGVGDGEYRLVRRVKGRPVFRHSRSQILIRHRATGSQPGWTIGQGRPLHTSQPGLSSVESEAVLKAACRLQPRPGLWSRPGGVDWRGEARLQEERLRARQCGGENSLYLHYTLRERGSRTSSIKTTMPIINLFNCTMLFCYVHVYSVSTKNADTHTHTHC